MEEVEAGLLESGIGWLTETILENLDTDKLDDWIRQVGLAADTEKLRAEIERVDGVVAAVKGRAIGNRSLARSLGRLRGLLYDADDAIDELDYYRLQQQVEGGVTTRFEAEDTVGDGAEDEGDIPMDNTDVPAAAAGRSRKKRSKVWEHFTPFEYTADEKLSRARCNYCDMGLSCLSTNGTSSLHSHLRTCKKYSGTSDQPPNPSSTGDGAPNGNSVAAGNSVHKKRRRTNEESTQNVPAKPWNKAEFSNRIQQITRHLQQAMNEILRLHGSDSFASSNLYHNTSSDSHPMTSSLVQRKMYGRAVEKNFVIKLMTEDDSNAVTVVPIVGIGGIGKTALAQHIYNDPVVGRQFQHRIWVCVSNNFDEIRLTREMLDFVCQEKYDGLCSFAKLQESLMSNIRSKRFLLILDDVWDDMNIFRWNKMLAPLKSNNAKGNVILVTTRSLSVAKMIGTVELIKLGALDKKDFWTLFTACAFGEEKYKAQKCLSTIAQQIADKLKGNPLAAESAGELLCVHHTVDHWNNILKKEDWKSLQLSGGIMPSLKLSYDQLPSHLQRCFLYCSIFPSDYRFVGAELIRIWTSQGFLKCSHSNKKMEEIGQEYLTELVNLGFFELVERKESTLSDQTCYVMCGLMHDFARIISITEYAVIDGRQCNKMGPTTRHLSILINSTYHGDPCNEKFEEIIKKTVPSLRNLRILVLIGTYAFSFSESVKDIVQKAQKLRLLQVCSFEQTYNHFDPLLCNLVDPTHIRYIKIDKGPLPQSLSKFYHLQVLDAGFKPCLIMPNDMGNLVSLRHLVAPERVYASMASISKMITLQEVHGFDVQIASSSEITLLQSMNQIVHLGVSKLENVTAIADASGARLRDKQNLERLHLSWSSYLTLDECDNAREVLEGLEPHKNLKHLQISLYNGATSPSWLATSLTSLQTLRLVRCGHWKILPSLDRLPFLRKMELRSMEYVEEVLIPSLEELMLIKMPKLERCSCTSMRDLNSGLRVLEIDGCPALKVFPLFENCRQFQIDPASWFSRLSYLGIQGCLDLHVENPLPPSPIVSKLSIARVSTIPRMEGSSSGTLIIGNPDRHVSYWDSNKPITLDDKVLSFHNLRFLTRLVISCCLNLKTISFKGLRQLKCLKSLEIYNCPELLSSNVPSELTREDTAGENCNVLPSLELLHIRDCGITGKWLSLILQHKQALEELSLHNCNQITGISIPEKENSQPNLISVTEAPSLEYTGREELLHLPLNLIHSLKKLFITQCSHLTIYVSKEVFTRFTSLEELKITRCPKLLSSFAQNAEHDEKANGRWFLPQSLGQLEIECVDSLKTLQPCFPGDLTSLKKLKVGGNPSLTSLQLHSCTALQELIIQSCESLNALEGLQSLGNFRLLKAHNCLIGYGEHGRCILPQSLEELYINQCSQEMLQPCFPDNLTSLKKLEVEGNQSLTSLQLHYCTALQELIIENCKSLNSLEGLQSLVNLRLLRAHRCLSGYGEDGRCILPQSLEELYIDEYSQEILQPCFQTNLTCLKKLEVSCTASFQSLELQSCTALEHLKIEECASLATLEGLQFLHALKRMKVLGCPILPLCLGSSSGQGYELCPRLERLKIDDPSILTTLFCKHLTSLQRLELNSCGSEVARLTDEQERALQLLLSLQELRFVYCDNLVDLPAGLHSLSSLKRLEIRSCESIARLPEKGLPPSLEELDINYCTEELTQQCRTVASKLKVKINGRYVN